MAPGQLIPAQAGVPERDLTRYRKFQMGMALTAVVKEVGPTPESRVVHRRPALIQQLDWFPRRGLGEVPDESVREMSFEFFEGQLSRITIEYDRTRTEGLLVGDIIAALAIEYGPAARPLGVMMASMSRGAHDSDEILANWEDARSTVTLFRPEFLSSFGLVLTDRRLDGLFRRAADEGDRLDSHDTPQRDLDRQRVMSEEELTRLTQARQTNKETFRP